MRKACTIYETVPDSNVRDHTEKECQRSLEGSVARSRVMAITDCEAFVVGRRRTTPTMPKEKNLQNSEDKVQLSLPAIVEMTRGDGTRDAVCADKNERREPKFFPSVQP